MISIQSRYSKFIKYSGDANIKKYVVFEFEETQSH